MSNVMVGLPAQASAGVICSVLARASFSMKAEDLTVRCERPRNLLLRGRPGDD